jgi:hypothetical protein
MPTPWSKQARLQTQLKLIMGPEYEAGIERASAGLLLWVAWRADKQRKDHRHLPAHERPLTKQAESLRKKGIAA